MAADDALQDKLVPLIGRGLILLGFGYSTIEVVVSLKFYIRTVVMRRNLQVGLSNIEH